MFHHVKVDPGEYDGLGLHWNGHYIDFCIVFGIGVLSVAHVLYIALLDLMSDLGLTMSQKKLVAPSMQVTRLDVMIDTLKCTIAIPPKKARTN